MTDINQPKEREFNLSNKRKSCLDMLNGGQKIKYNEEDIKEFIKRLKEEFGDYFFRDDMPNRYKDAIKIIDKLAGKDLI